MRVVCCIKRDHDRCANLASMLERYKLTFSLSLPLSREDRSWLLMLLNPSMLGEVNLPIEKVLSVLRFVMTLIYPVVVFFNPKRNLWVVILITLRLAVRAIKTRLIIACNF